MIADYYLGIWGGGIPKPFKFTEIQRHRFGLADKEGSADRKVPIQPLVFTSKDGLSKRYNLRKVSEEYDLRNTNPWSINMKLFAVW